MVRLSNFISLLGLVAAASAQSMLCDNTCWFKFFTGKCEFDNSECVCTMNDLRNDYFCCLAKNCGMEVLNISINRQILNCGMSHISFDPHFNVEAVCGFEPTSSLTRPSTILGSTSKISSPTSTDSVHTSQSSSAVVTSTPTVSTTTAMPSNGTITATTTVSLNPTTSTSPATTSAVPGSGSRATLQSAGVVLGLVAFVAAAL